MPVPLRAVSLDLDNTLWDTPPVLLRAEQALAAWLAEHHPAIVQRFDAAALAQLRAAAARSAPERAHDLSWVRGEALRRAARATGLGDEVAAQAFEVFIAERNRVEPFADVAPALRRLAARVPLYALSNGNACVQRVGLGEFFAGAVDPVRAGAPKPDPRIFAHLVELSGHAPAAILHVGDDVFADVVGARAAGLRTAWMNRSAAPWPDDVAPAEHVVADLGELACLVESLTGDG